MPFIFNCAKCQRLVTSRKRTAKESVSQRTGKIFKRYCSRKCRDDAQRVDKTNPLWIEHRRARQRHYKRLWTYKLSEADYNKMLLAQGRRCAICARSERKLVVDHDHKTGEVRGLLCSACNGALGKFGDSIELLAVAIAYVARPVEAERKIMIKIDAQVEADDVVLNDNH